MSPAAANATVTLTAEVESIMGTLASLLDRETNAVRVSDYNAFKELQSDKFAMLSRYRSIMDTLQRQAGAIAAADGAVAERLRLAANTFRTAADRNADALNSGCNSMQRIVDRIVRCAREHVHANRQSYTKKGSSGGPSTPLSIQLDQVL